MNVREFTSNAWQEVLKLPESDRGGTESTKLLGLVWNLKEDTLTIKLPKFTEEKVTRRTILSQIAKPYDPLGLISPVILKGKLLRQQAEKDKNLNWDKPVDQKSEEDWKKLIKTWNDQSITVSRKCWNSGEDRSKIELHGFADASIYGIGIAIYLRRIGNKIETTLAFAKSLVIPSIIGKRKTSIPSLELHAMKICCTNIEFVKQELEKENKIEKVRLWTDAADVIDYLTTGKEKDRFVKNRIKVIKNDHVTHVVGKDNPADLASRGCSVEELKESKIWFKGPEWLSKEEAIWPTSLKEYNPETFVPQENTSAELQLSLGASDINEEIIPICNFERFSQWKRVHNCMAYVLRAVEHFKHPDKERRKILNNEINLVPPLTTNETTSAEIFLILEAQEMFPPKEESIRNLGLFQEHGMWRAGGRLQKSKLEPNAIHPIYLHQAAPIVPLIIADMHKERKHTGTINLCAALRQTYWIPKCRRTVVNVIQKNLKTKCHLCERYYVKAYDYPEAPHYRITVLAEKKFGKQQDGKSTLKIWGAIFVCALSRIIHLELVLDATAEKFLLAFTRFARRWRIPKRIISDNGTNFVLGSKGLKKLCQENAKERQLWLEIYEKREVKEYSAKDKIEWVFITPFAPWRGGLYERMIGVVKHHLKRVIARKTMSTEEMWTLLVEVERIVNERPITFLSESEVLKPLRPIDLAFPLMKANEMDIATEPFEKDDPNYFEQSNSRESLIDKYKNAVSAAEWFWKEWKKSYLLALREKHVNCAKKPQLRPEEGDVVIIEDKNAPRNLWKLGKITEILSVRTAKVRVGNKEFERAIKHLYPLEVKEFGVVEEMDKVETNQSKGVKTEKEIKISEKFEDSNNFAISDQQKMEEDLIQIDETEAIFSKEELEQAEKILDEEEEDTISLDGGVIIEIATETKLIPKEKQRFSTTQGGNFRVDVPTWLLGDDNIEILGEVVREKEYRALTSNYPLESVWWTTLPGRAKLNQLLTTVIFWCSMLSPNIYGVLDWLTRIPGLQVIWIGERPPPYHPITWVHPNADTNLKMLLGMLVGVGAKFELTKIRKRKRSSQNSIPQEKFPQVAVVPRLSGPSTSGSSSAVVPSNNSAVVPLNNKYPNHIYEVFADHQLVKNYPTVPNYNPLAGEIVFIPSKGEAIAFFTKRYILSNFWPSTFWLHEQQYFSVEQYYCEQKCLLLGRLEAAKEVMRTYSPAQAKNLAALRTHQEMVDWSRVKYGVMMEGLTAKFSLPQEKEILISTHPAMLLEASSDTDWGTGERLEQRMRVGRGDNNLGKLLMILRDTIIKGEQQVPMFEDSDRDFRSCASSPTPSVQTMNSAPWGSTVVSISQQPTVELGKENEQVVDPTVELVDGPEQKLEQKIWKLFEITMENCYDERFDFIEKLSSILEKEIGECRTFPFGSTLSRLAKVNTDIDVFVFTPEVNLVKEEKLKLIRNVLRKHFEFEKLVVIANAKCPVMVAKVKNGFSVDITVGGANDMKGIYNSLAINILGRLTKDFESCSVRSRHGQEK
uniref:Integrase catalytic domain-containing protein n=1 Tax=Meloidogyne enterolobii TaxID=390850 RepID=A0A6V7WXD4_MELEN|nr:unnamed protein product [Meloidogyne enterolobii]